LIAEAPNRDATEWTRAVTLDNGATSQCERTEEQVHRRPDHLVEITGAGNLLSQVG
jgi:hypothetical protein